MTDKKALRKERLQKRNIEIRNLFRELSEKQKRHKAEAIINEIALKMFLSPRTIEAIIFYEGIYKD
ncbi:hypothetical protein [uncultured Capnocytophaga sp.]|uniref:hypothetical protein n=1 Tax=uncultured Capnocytophaga sp. TaxID=159273 RepID=UPI002636360E|nr:hypothetical protein [uncultured Capnocytophaga sp.]